MLVSGVALAAAQDSAGNNPANGNAGPPGAGPQTMPSTISPANAQADKYPTMGRPLPLSDEQKHRILATIAAAPARVARTDAKPAQQLPPSVAMQDLPPSLADIAVVQGYKYVDLPDRVIFVAPANRTVVGEIAK
jgi:hypothetical protein